MDDIFKTLYYTELEDTEILSKNYKTKGGSAYENLLRALSDEQKTLFFIYEAENNAEHCDYGRLIYRAAFKTGFRLAQELLSQE